jgi:hypothetical protein
MYSMPSDLIERTPLYTSSIEVSLDASLYIYIYIPQRTLQVMAQQRQRTLQAMAQQLPFPHREDPQPQSIS